MRRRATWLMLLALAGLLFVLDGAPQPAMAVVSCGIYCPSHVCSGPCYCAALQRMASCGTCPNICINRAEPVDDLSFLE